MSEYSDTINIVPSQGVTPLDHTNYRRSVDQKVRETTWSEEYRNP